VIISREDGHWIVNPPQFVYTVMDQDWWVNIDQWVFDHWNWVRCHVHAHGYRYHIISSDGTQWEECLLCHKQWRSK
jgi:hypothetical protein